MSNITLKQLRYFQALTRQGHFGRAADLCAVSQPALSVQIKNLEDTLGLPLFERGARDLRLTRFGEDFARRVHDILRDVDALGDLARAARDRPVSRLRLGVIPTIAPYLLPRLIPDLTRAYPGLEIHIRETLTPRLVQDLSDGRIDAAVLALPVAEDWLAQHPLRTEDFVVVQPASDPPAPPPTRETLTNAHLLLLEEGHCLRDQVLSFCALNGPRINSGLDGSALSTLVQMVGAGLGITLLPEMAINVETRSAAVRVARFHGASPQRTIGMVWRKASPLADQMAEFAPIVGGSIEALARDTVDTAPATEDKMVYQTPDQPDQQDPTHDSHARHRPLY